MAARRSALGRAGALLVIAALAGACTRSPASSARSTTTTTTTATTTTIVITTTTLSAPSTTTTVVPTPTISVALPATVAAVPDGPAFTGVVSIVTAADLGASWRPGCPVAPDDLRLLRMTYWGFDNAPHAGSLVVAATVTGAMLEVFRTLYDQRFPIRQMVPVDAYGGDDDASMAVDNTSGFNCRPAVTDGPAHWSNHAYGLAIDVNPVENPYLLGGRVLPPAGADYTDRSVYRPGMAVEGGVLTSAFAAVGWGWGGTWSSPDYQHFSANGG